MSVVVQFNVEKSLPVSEILYLHVIVSPSETDSGKNVDPPGLTCTWFAERVQFEPPSVEYSAL